MATRREATIEDLRNVPENGKAEIVDGELVLMTPAGGVHGYAGREICASLRAYELVVWDVDVLRAKCVRVYRASSPESPTTYERGDLAEAEPALPGWRMAVADLFPSET